MIAHARGRNFLAGKKPDYEELYCRVAQMYGWTFDEIDDMTYVRFFMACRAKRMPSVAAGSRGG